MKKAPAQYLDSLMPSEFRARRARLASVVRFEYKPMLTALVYK